MSDLIKISGELVIGGSGTFLALCILLLLTFGLMAVLLLALLLRGRGPARRRANGRRGTARRAPDTLPRMLAAPEIGDRPSASRRDRHTVRSNAE